MFRYGKTARAGISVMSYLAQHEATGDAPGSAEIARARGISRALAAKLLTTLSRHGLVKGRPGPNGGYRLAKAPSEIHLRDVVEVFEPMNEDSPCPFGPNWCGTGDPCPLHDKIVEQEETYRRFLEETTFVGFNNPKEGPTGEAE